MLSEADKKKVLQYVSIGLKPPGVAFSQAAILFDFSVLFHVIMNDKDQTDIYGWLGKDPETGKEILAHIDAWDWLALGGLRILAQDRGIDLTEVSQDER